MDSCLSVRIQSGGPQQKFPNLGIRGRRLRKSSLGQMDRLMGHLDYEVVAGDWKQSASVRLDVPLL